MGSIAPLDFQQFRKQQELEIALIESKMSRRIQRQIDEAPMRVVNRGSDGLFVCSFVF
jgi:hypothetical protein